MRTVFPLNGPRWLTPTDKFLCEPVQVYYDEFSYPDDGIPIIGAQCQMPTGRFVFGEGIDGQSAHDDLLRNVELPGRRKFPEDWKPLKSSQNDETGCRFGRRGNSIPSDSEDRIRRARGKRARG